jgi:hypothetical protein
MQMNAKEIKKRKSSNNKKKKEKKVEIIKVVK